MKLIKENIEFKRGKDSKKALDIGMTNEMLYNDTIEKMKSMGLVINPSKSANSFYIPFHGNKFVLTYNHNSQIWKLKTEYGFLHESYYEGFWPHAFSKLKKYHDDKRAELLDELDHHKYYSDKIEEFVNNHED